jgi:hypothetical protein
MQCKPRMRGQPRAGQHGRTEVVLLLLRGGDLLERRADLRRRLRDGRKLREGVVQCRLVLEGLACHHAWHVRCAISSAMVRLKAIYCVEPLQSID